MSVDARLEVTRELALDRVEIVADRLEDLREIRRAAEVCTGSVTLELTGTNLRESDHRFRAGCQRAEPFAVE